MLFSTILSVASVFSFATIVSAGPVPAAGVVARQEDQALTVFQTLQGDITPVLSQITDLVNAGNVTYDDISPLFGTLEADLKTALASLKSIPTSKRGVVSRQSGDELADLVAEIVEAVVDVLETLVGDLAEIPLLAELLNGIDGALANLLSELELLLAGVLTTVATLLKNVAGLLTDLAFDLTLAALGL